MVWFVVPIDSQQTQCVVVLWLGLSLLSVSKHNIWSCYCCVCHCCCQSV